MVNGKSPGRRSRKGSVVGRLLFVVARLGGDVGIGGGLDVVGVAEVVGFGGFAEVPILDYAFEPAGNQQIAEHGVFLPRLDQETNGEASDRGLYGDPAAETHDAVDVGEEVDFLDLLAEDSDALLVANELQLVLAESEETDVFMGVEDAVVACRGAADEDDGTGSRGLAMGQISHRIAPDAAVFEEPKKVQGEPAQNLAANQKPKSGANDDVGADDPINAAGGGGEPEEGGDEIAQPFAP